MTIVLAAGQFAQQRAALLPKSALLAGRPMVRCVADVAHDLGSPKVVLVAEDAGVELLREAAGSSVTSIVQSEQAGVARALQQAAPAPDGQAGTVLVLCGDAPLIRRETLMRLLEHHNTQRAAVTLLTFQPASTSGFSRVVLEAGTERVLALVDDEHAVPEDALAGQAGSGILCFGGAWLWPNLQRALQRADGQVELDDLVRMACDQGEMVTALPAADALEVMRVNDQLKLAQAEAEMRRRINERWMLAGVTIVDPQTTYVQADVEIGAGSVIWPNTFLQGQTRVGQACTIGPGTVIRDSLVGDRCKVELSVLEQAIMEEGSDIGPFGHLRKGAHLGPGVHMGNFGEVKNSYLGPGVKMGHMSYLGDAMVGAEANIGAGTITCNFDGEKKSRTVIGDGAFIGSDTMLIAPVEVGAGAKTGAGSVVTRDVPAGSVAYGVPARTHSEPGPENSEVG